MMEVEWRRLRADQLRAAVAANPVVILPLGSLEQHGPHLPVEVDSTLVEAVALETARMMQVRQVGALVLPTMWAGISEHHMSFGGTITIDVSTFITMVGQVCRAVARLGFGRIVLLNGHGGNEWAMRAAADDLTPALGIPIVAMTYWNVAAEAIAEVLTSQSRLLHACEAETAMMMALRPTLVAHDRIPSVQPLIADEPGIHRWRRLADVSPVGVIGAPAAASAETGQRLITVIAEALAIALARPGLWT